MIPCYINQEPSMNWVRAHPRKRGVADLSATLSHTVHEVLVFAIKRLGGTNCGKVRTACEPSSSLVGVTGCCQARPVKAQGHPNISEGLEAYCVSRQCLNVQTSRTFKPSRQRHRHSSDQCGPLRPQKAQIAGHPCLPPAPIPQTGNETECTTPKLSWMTSSHRPSPG